MTKCPVCSDVLLRHIRSGRSYWLCRSCRLEISGHQTVPTVEQVVETFAVPRSPTHHSELATKPDLRLAHPASDAAKSPEAKFRSASKASGAKP